MIFSFFFDALSVLFVILFVYVALGLAIKAITR